MYSHTKKVGRLGRYGARMGARLRAELCKIEDESKQRHICPQCGKKKVKRENGSGIWFCSGCNTKFAGGAFVPYYETLEY